MDDAPDLMDIAEDTAEDVAEDTAEDVAEDIAEDVAEEPAEDVAEEPAEDVAEDVAEDPAEGVAVVADDTEEIFAVYSSLDDEGYPVAYVYDDGTEVFALDGVSASDFTTEELLFQVNQNIVDFASLSVALVGCIIGLICSIELLKLWLQS